MANKNNDLAHTKWMCKYHIVFTPKYRRKIIYNQLTTDITYSLSVDEKKYFCMKMMSFSDNSYIDIRISLIFSSHSHFIATFNKYVNMTPKEYRNKFYGKQWDMDSEEGSE